MTDEKGTLLHSLSFPAKDRDLYDWVQEQAEKRKTSVNEVIRDCMRVVKEGK